MPCRLPPAQSGRVKRLDPVCVLKHGLRRPKAALNVTTPRRQVLSTLPKPQRSLWARLALPDGQVVTVVSWHTPNAAGDSRAVKMDAYQAMTDWLHDSHPERDRHPVVLSADLNTWHDPIGHPPPPRTTFATPSSTSSASTPAIA